jgi:hypothetical protein
MTEFLNLDPLGWNGFIPQRIERMNIKLKLKERMMKMNEQSLKSIEQAIDLLKQTFHNYTTYDDLMYINKHCPRLHPDNR